MKKVFFWLAAMLLFACNNAQSTFVNLNANEFEKKIQAGNVQLLDVRTAEEFAEKHLAGAQNIDYNSDDFKTKVQSLNKEQAVLVYCLSGGRSSKASALLKELGFKEVYNLDGGITSWIGAGKAVEGDQPTNTGMTKEDYDKKIKSEKLVLVDFFATWCGPCKKMKPQVEALAKKNEAKMTLEEIDTDQNTALAASMDVNAIPLFILYKDGKEIWRQLGEFNIDDLQKVIDKN